MKAKLYLNREPLPSVLAAGETLKGVIICPIGDWPHGENVQHVTAEAIADMVRNADGEILVDFDHDAESGGPTAAAAWIKNLRAENDALVGDFTFTDEGAAAVSSRRYRFLSPCWEVTGTEPDLTPVRLLSVALTNKPNIPMSPVLNADPSRGGAAGGSAAAAPSAAINNPKKENSMDPKKIIEALGLPPEATEEEIVSAIGSLKAQVEAAAAEKTEAEAEAFAEANKEKCNKEVLKAQFIANREATIALVNAITAPARPATVCNAAQAKPPAAAHADPMKGLANCKTPEERIAYLNAHAKEF